MKAAKTPEVARTAPKVDWTTVTNGQVRVELCEAWRPTTNVWPSQPLAVTDKYFAPAFGFARVPEKYVDTGVRAERGHPYFFRALGVVNLPRRQAPPPAPRPRRLGALHRRPAHHEDALPSARHRQQTYQGAGRLSRPRRRLSFRPAWQP